MMLNTAPCGSLITAQGGADVPIGLPQRHWRAGRVDDEGHPAG
jgi:hypothetical protein